MPSIVRYLSTGNIPRCLVCMASGALLTTAYAPRQWSFVVWIWMIPFLAVLWAAPPDPTSTRLKKFIGCFIPGYLAGLCFFIPNLAWVRHSSRVINGAMDDRWMGWSAEMMGWIAVFAMCGYLSLYWGIWSAYAATIGRPRLGAGAVARPLWGDSLESIRAAFLNASLWAGLEWARGIVLSGFPWNGLSVPLASELALVQSADMIGASGLSFLPVFCACIAISTTLRFVDEVRHSRVRPHLDFFCAVALVLCDFGYGFRILSAPAPRNTVPLRVLLVQQNISQVTKWKHEQDEAIYHGYERLTLPFAERVDLVIWPESALPLPFGHPAHVPFLNQLLARGNFSLLAGVDFFEKSKPNYTGAALMRGSTDQNQLYRKIQLVPFGEFLPLRSISLVDKLLGGVLPGDFTSGTSTEPLVLEQPPGVQIIPLICFEDTFGRLARKFVRDAPQLLVNCTNDGWFLHSEENEQHLATAIFRCIELRRPMVRAANTGVSCVVSPEGRILPGDRLVNHRTGSVFTEGALYRELKLDKNPPRTFYARHGDVFCVTLLGISGLSVILALRRRTT